MPQFDSPLVSIIMPAYNSAAFLREAVESVLNQSYGACELIVVDDGSTDDTRQLLETYGSRLRYVYQENHGQSAARNRGLSLAQGEYIAFLDADDMFPPDAIEKRLAQFQKLPSADVILSGWRIVDLHGQPIVGVEPWHEVPHLELMSLLLWKPAITGTITCRRECIDQVAGFDAELNHAQDLDLVFRIALAGFQIRWLPQITLSYRRWEGSASTEGPVSARDMDRALDKVFGSPQVPHSVLEREPEVRYYTDLWYGWHAAQLGFLDEFRGRLIKALETGFKPLEVAPLDWLSNFRRWSATFGRRELTADECLDAFQDAMPTGHRDGEPTLDLLQFWLRVWRHYLAGEGSNALQGLQAYSNIEARQLVKWVQTLIFISSEEIQPQLIARFWADALREGIVDASAKQEVLTLYLSIFSRQVFARRWTEALEALFEAAGAGLHPRAARPWYRFLRSALRYGMGEAKP